MMETKVWEAADGEWISILDTLHQHLSRRLAVGRADMPQYGFFLFPTYRILHTIDWDLTHIIRGVAVKDAYNILHKRKPQEPHINHAGVPTNSRIFLTSEQRMTCLHTEKLWGGTTEFVALYDAMLADQQIGIDLDLPQYINYAWVLDPPSITLPVSYAYPSECLNVNWSSAKYQTLIRHRVLPLMCC
jgi:hypothetical protein